MPAKTTIRWGILGPGNIARSFAAALAEAEGAQLVAVGSRSLERARDFAAAFATGSHAPRAHGSYAELANDPQVDAVYIASPHSEHHDHTLLCLEAGKHVLCEKALALNAAQAAAMIAAARRHRLALMEAMWTRFLPLYGRIRTMIARGDLGEVRLLQADFGFRAPFDEAGRLFNPTLAGGALLDLGVYPVSLSSMLLGAPTAIRAEGNLASTGVDQEVAAVLHHAGGGLTVLSASLVAETPREAVIVGTEGRLRILTPWWGGTRMVVTLAGQEEELVTLPPRGRGDVHQAEAFMDLIRSGETESPLMPLAESLAVMQTLDEIRRQVGVVYPQDG